MKIVTIGGGNGQTIALRALEALEPRPEITAVVTVFDSGGSSGRLRKETGILPPGDLLRALLALSSYDYPSLRKLFYTHRFTAPSLEGHSLGNLIISGLFQRSGNFLEALRSFGQSLAIRGVVWPVSIDQTNLVLELASGDKIFGEYNIGSNKYSKETVRQRLFLEPEAHLLPQAKAALAAADYIVLGPGDLFTSLLPNLVVKDVAKTLLKTRAKLVYILNSANRINGETFGFQASDYLKEFKKYLPRDFDYIIIQDFPESIMAQYGAVGWEEVGDDLKNTVGQVIHANLELPDRIGTNWQKLASVLKAICR